MDRTIDRHRHRVRPGERRRAQTERLLAALLDEIRAEFPAFRLIHKRDAVLQRSIAAALFVLTLGAQRGYLARYVTTIGQRIYVPDGWERWTAGRRWAVLRHELVHLRQFRRSTLPLMGLLYLLFPLPFGLAWARMRYERAAYEESIRAAAMLYGRRYVCRRSVRKRIIRQFTSGAYGWMWPFPKALDRWYDAVLATIDA